MDVSIIVKSLTAQLTVHIQSTSRVLSIIFKILLSPRDRDLVNIELKLRVLL